MLKFLFGAFIVLHGLVHLLYFGQSYRLFELQPDLLWPDGSWAFSRLVGEEGTRMLASAGLALAAAGFVVGGVALFLIQTWWRPLVVASAIFAAVLFLLLWDGSMQRLDDKGAIGLLINGAILVAILLLRWPALE